MRLSGTEAWDRDAATQGRGPARRVLERLSVAGMVLVLGLTGPLAPVAVRAAETDADLSLSGSGGPNPVAAGDTLTYNLQLFNNGPAAATGVTLTDTLPAGSAFESATPWPSGSCEADSGVVTCDLGSIEPFAGASVDIVVTAPATTGTITNSATVSGTEVDPSPDDNTWSEDTEVVTPQADLTVQQSDDPDPVAGGGALTYSVDVFNFGPLDATGFTLTDTLPAGVTFVSATPDQGSCAESAGIVTCDLGTVERSQNVSAEIVVTVPTSIGTITNTASVEADQDDLNPDDNTSSEDTEVVEPGTADLEVTQSDSSDPAGFGSELTYVVVVSNAGPATATDVSLTDTLPTGVPLVSATPSQGDCETSAGTVTCDLGSIARSEQAFLDVVVTAPSEVTTITNTAVVTSSLDPNSSNDSSTEDTDIRPPCHPAVCIDNDTVLLAVNPEGHLNAPDGSGSAAGAGDVGLMFLTTGNDSTSPGCLCEGWGAADAGTDVTGYANISSDGGVNNMVLESFSSTASTALSTVNIQDTLRVTHNYHPAGATANLYEATVTIENLTEAALTDIRYRRVMDWDIQPTPFAEFVTIDGGTATNLLFDSNDGFATANPLGARTDLGSTGDFVDQGPADHGALFDFGFGALPGGESLSFNIYYGAAADEAGALTAINAVGAEVYSLGQPSTEDGPTLGTPNTFVFAFAGVGGDPIFSPIAVDDTLTVAEDTPGSLNVLANDSDPDDDPITLTEATDPANGTAVCEPDGDCTYTPDTGFIGTDSFDYTITDGNGGFDTATVTITVNAVSFTLTVSLAGAGSGSVSSSPPGIDCGSDCSEAYDDGTVVTLTATPATGSDFSGWSGAGCSGTGTCQVTMDQARSVTATFALEPTPTFTLTVSLAGAGSGSVSSSPPGIDCGSDCSEAYDDGTVVTLTATPATGSDFSGWSGAGCSGTGTCQVTMDQARSVTATFALEPTPTFTLTVSLAGAGSGSVSSSPPGIDCGSDCSEAYDDGTVVTLTATPATGSDFSGWSGAGCSGTGTCQVTMDQARSVTATFALEPTPTFTLTVSLAGAGSGSVSSSPPGIDCGSDCSEAYDDGTVVTLTATPATGSDFSGWSGAGCSGTGTCQVTMDQARSVTATFALEPTPTFTLTVSLAGAGSGSVSSSPPGIDCGSDCSEAYDDGTVVTLTATPATGSDFSGWSGAGCSGTGTCQVTMDQARSVTATFALEPTPTFTLTVSLAGAGSGSVSSSPPGIDCGSDCSEAYDDGTVVTLTATPATGSDFSGWSGAGCSGTGTCQVTMDQARSVTATFALEPTPTFTLTVSLAGAGSGSVSSSPPGIDCGSDCSEAYDDGTVVTLTATPATGSDFSGWSGAGCSGTGTCQVTMDQARSVTATFALEPTPSADLSVTQTDSPDPVTAGNAIHYFLTVTNSGPDGATGIVLVDTLPAGSTLVAAESPGCTTDSGVVTCTIGSLASGASVNISIVVMAPTVATTTTITNTATVSGNEDDPSLTNNTSSEMTSVQPATTNPDVASGWITAAGGTVATNAGKPPTKKDPMTTAVTVPPGFPGMVTIVEGPITTCPASVVCFGQQAEITAPTTTASQPLRLAFSYHPGSLPPGTQLHEITMFHDGIEVPRCADRSGMASPDPCIFSVARGKGAVTVVVLSSENGSWIGGR